MRLPRARFTVSAAMGVVLALAVAMAALRNANELWAGFASLLTLASLGVAVLGVIQERARAQARWLGFLVFAGGYFAFAFGPWLSERVGPTLLTTQLLAYAHMQVTSSPRSRSPEIQTLLDRRDGLAASLQYAKRISRNTFDPTIGRFEGEIAKADGQITAILGYPLPAAVNGAGGQSPSPSSQWRALVPGAANHDQFVRVGHCLFALVAGAIGAAISARLYSRSGRQPGLPAEAAR